MRFYFMVIAGLLITGGSVWASEMDARIEAAARQSYVFKTYLKNDEIKISASDGFVSLAGTVSEESHKKLAQETVSNLPGVISVENSLEVKSDAPGQNPDTWLKAKVTTALMLHQKVNPETQVYVNEGTVTLRGDATSQEQKEQTGEYVKGIHGVKDVKNEMKVCNGKTKQKLLEKIDDTSVTAQVKVALLNHCSRNMVNTKVKTNKGEVTLYGKAGSEEEKKQITELVRGIRGVKEITNALAIKEDK